MTIVTQLHNYFNTQKSGFLSYLLRDCDKMYVFDVCYQENTHLLLCTSEHMGAKKVLTSLMYNFNSSNLECTLLKCHHKQYTSIAKSSLLNKCQGLYSLAVGRNVNKLIEFYMQWCPREWLCSLACDRWPQFSSISQRYCSSCHIMRASLQELENNHYLSHNLPLVLHGNIVNNRKVKIQHTMNFLKKTSQQEERNTRGIRKTTTLFGLLSMVKYVQSRLPVKIQHNLTS